MKQRLVIWGKDPKDERVLMALDLHPDAKTIDVFSFPEEVATEELNNLLMNQWRNEKPVEFPDQYDKYQTELSLSESILPDGYSVDKKDILKRAQTEWNFVAMSTKMSKVYHEELQEFRERVDALDEFDHDLWEELKAYWDKVQTQIRDKNLIKEHADSLRKKTNQVFADMKVLRRKMDEKFREESAKTMEKYMNILDEIEEKIEKGLGLKPIFEELKEIQRDFNEERFTRQHRSQVWQRLDGAFKTVKKKRFGDKGKGRSKLQHLQRRYDGLIDAIEKMESSIRRDQNDRNYHDNRIEEAGGQLESQIRKAKIKMIEERIRSKKNKLDDMHDTKQMLEDRIEKAKKKKQSESEKQEQEEQPETKETSEESASGDKESSGDVDEEKKSDASSEKQAGGTAREHFEEIKEKTQKQKQQSSSEEEE